MKFAHSVQDFIERITGVVRKVLRDGSGAVVKYAEDNVRDGTRTNCLKGFQEKLASVEA